MNVLFTSHAILLLRKVALNETPQDPVSCHRTDHRLIPEYRTGRRSGFPVPCRSGPAPYSVSLDAPSTALVSSAALPSTGDLYQTTTSVNFRSGPSTAHSVIRTLSAGTKVELLAKYSSTWYKVSLSGTVGYVSARYLTRLTTSIPATATTYLTTTSVNFRTGPSTAYSIIRKLTAGTSVTLISKYSSTWYKVSVAGTTGYLSAAYLKLSGTAITATAIPVHSIGYLGGLHKKIADLRPYLNPAWNGYNYMSASTLQTYLDKGLLVTWGAPLYNYDNKTTMILGHGSGVFNYMINVREGSLVSISDLNGKVRTYKIIDVKSNPTSNF